MSAADGLRIEPYDADRLAIALPLSHRLAASPDLKLSDIAEEQMIIWPRSQGPGFHDQVMRLCGEAGFAPCIAQEAHGMHAVLSLVAVEMGLAIVPASMASVLPAEPFTTPIALKTNEILLQPSTCTHICTHANGGLGCRFSILVSSDGNAPLPWSANIFARGPRIFCEQCQPPRLF